MIFGCTLFCIRLDAALAFKQQRSNCWWRLTSWEASEPGSSGCVSCATSSSPPRFRSSEGLTSIWLPGRSSAVCNRSGPCRFTSCLAFLQAICQSTGWTFRAHGGLATSERAAGLAWKRGKGCPSFFAYMHVTTLAGFTFLCVHKCPLTVFAQLTSTTCTTPRLASGCTMYISLYISCKMYISFLFTLHLWKPRKSLLRTFLHAGASKTFSCQDSQEQAKRGAPQGSARQAQADDDW